MHQKLRTRSIFDAINLNQLLKTPEQVDSSAENNNLSVNNNTANTANHSIEQWRYAFKLSYIQSGELPSNDSIRETMSIKPQLSHCSPCLGEFV